MIGEFLLRLAVALPLILLLAVASLWAMRRGWIRLPASIGLSGLAPVRGLGRDAGAPGFELVASRGIQPGVQILLLRHGGQELLVGVSPQGLALLSAQPRAIAATTAAHGDAA